MVTFRGPKGDMSFHPIVRKSVREGHWRDRIGADGCYRYKSPSERDLAMPPKNTTQRVSATPSLQRPAWWSDAEAARKAALSEARPCVLILNVDSSAL